MLCIPSVKLINSFDLAEKGDVFWSSALLKIDLSIYKHTI